MDRDPTPSHPPDRASSSARCGPIPAHMSVTAPAPAGRPTGTDLRYRSLWGLVPAMAMVMIDFTIVSISVTSIQQDLHLSATAAQWTVTAYALATAAFVALGGRLGDILGHKKIVVIGVAVFAASSLMCGLVPDNSSLSEPWLIVFRSLQGIGGALLIPSTTVLVLNSFPVDERGKGLAIFFIIAGLFTALGPIAGSYLTEYWTWRAIFWINVPVALLSLIELSRISFDDHPQKSRIDWTGAALLASGMALSVLGLQQSTAWGWGSPATIGSIVAGLALLAGFVAVERRAAEPLIDVKSFWANRAFATDNVVIFFFFTAWLSIFLFGSMYFQIAVGQPPSQAGFSILTVFYPFFITSRIGGSMFDAAGAKKPVVIGLVLTAVGMAMWAHEATALKHLNVLWGQLVTGAGLGFVMSAINTDALNRIGGAARGAASGVVQTTRNFGSAVGVALLGTVLITVLQDKAETLLQKAGLPTAQADAVATSILQSGAGPKHGESAGPLGKAIGTAIQTSFADAFAAALYVGAGLMAATAIFAVAMMPTGRQADVE